MAPLGRRRWGLLPVILALIGFLAAFPSIAAAAPSNGVIGIDIGTEYVKAALVQPGIPLEIVLTKDSKRKESAAVAFRPSRDKTTVFPERSYGGDALALAPRFPDDVYSNLKTLLGVPFDTGVQGPEAQEGSLVQMYANRYPATKLDSIEGRGTVGFRSNKVGSPEGDEPFMVEELLAMQLKQIKANAEALGGNGAKIADAVITYPAFYTAEEKRSLQLAAELAGLNVLSLMSDGLAVALNYAMTRSFPLVSGGQKPEYHVVFDMGAGSTTASVLKFQSRKVQDVGKHNKTVQEVYVLGTGWDKTLGGDALNALIVDDMITKFLASGKAPAKFTKESVRQHGRTMAIFWKEAERLRQILSANPDTSASFETIANEDVNYRYKLTRAEFEDMTSSYAKRVSKPLDDALEAAGLSMQEMESIILHGGASRTPLVQKALEQTCKKDSLLRTNVNADEAAVFGAAFKGAELSPAFRVKEIRTYDLASFTYGIKWHSGKRDRQQKMFMPTSQVGVEKQISVPKLEDFKFSFYQQHPYKGKPVDVELDRIETTNLAESVAALQDKFGCNASDISAKLSVRLRPVDGLPEVTTATVSCEVAEKRAVIDGVKGFFGIGKKSEQASSESTVTALGEPSETDTTTLAAGSQVNATSSLTPGNQPSPAPAKTRTEQVLIKFTVTPLNPKPVPAPEMARIKARLAAFDASDLAHLKREETFNALESFIYRSRHLLTDEEFTQYMPEAEQSTLAKRLDEVADWIELPTTVTTTVAMQERIDELQALLEPAQQRQREARAQEEAAAKLQAEMDRAAAAAKSPRNEGTTAESDASASASEKKPSSSQAKDEL